MTKRWFFTTVVFISIFTACTSDEVKDKVMNERINLPLETGKNIYITYTDSGYTKAKLFTPLLERYASDVRMETVMQKGITVYFYNRNKKAESSLKSKYAIRYDRDKKMIARNDVILVNNKGDSLNTEELIWDEVKQKIYSDKFNNLRKFSNGGNLNMFKLCFEMDKTYFAKYYLIPNGELFLSSIKLRVLRYSLLTNLPSSSILLLKIIC